VDAVDLDLVGGQFGTTGDAGDANRDGQVNVLDVVLVARLRGSCVAIPD
jgi:hypothetical protein